MYANYMIRVKSHFSFSFIYLYFIRFNTEKMSSKQNKFRSFYHSYSREVSEIRPNSSAIICVTSHINSTVRTKPKFGKCVVPFALFIFKILGLSYHVPPYILDSITVQVIKVSMAVFWSLRTRREHYCREVF